MHELIAYRRGYNMGSPGDIFKGGFMEGNEKLRFLS